MLWLGRTVFGNTLLRLAIALGVVAGGTALAWALKRGLGARLRRRSEARGTLGAAALAEGVARLRSWFFLGLALPLGAQFLDLPTALEAALGRVWPLVILIQAALIAHGFIGLWTGRRFLGDAHPDGGRVTRAALLGFLLRLALGSLTLLGALDLLGFNLTTLLASLGIGGLAVALAVQNLLGDLFASLSISLDQPFLIGDFIIVDDCLGTVVHIGLKSTRIQSLSGEQIVLSNADLLKSRIRNFKQLQERRVVLSFELPEGTPLERLRRVPRWVKEVIEAQATVRFDRSHLRAFSPCGLAFETVYFVLDPDYNLHMDRQEAIHLGLLEVFRREGLELAYPVRVLSSRPGAPQERGIRLK